MDDFHIPFATIGLAFVALFCLIIFIKILRLRRVVPPNEVHIVQSAHSTRSYGRSKSTDEGADQTNKTHGNTYYEWPNWLPMIGVRVSKLPVSNFDLKLNDYSAYDKNRVPFVLDLVGFFRIGDSNMAAERVSDIKALEEQLDLILKGAARKILANAPIDEILSNRAIFGQQFTDEVQDNLKQWGVIAVQSIELMDIRDAEGSKAITNIQSIQQSEIAKNSRVAVATNNREAQEAEIAAQQAVGIKQQDAEEKVGQRTAEKDRNVGISQQQAQQAIKDEEKTTAEKEIAVQSAMEVGKANIDKLKAIVVAEQNKAVTIVNADATKQKMATEAEGYKAKTVTEAQGARDSQLLLAEGIKAQGEATGAAETAKLLAPVNAQIALADKIDKSDNYQNYLVRIREVEKDQAVGVAQADALKAAEIKVIANSGSIPGGITSVGDLLSAKGGTSLGAMLEAIAQTDEGKKILSVINGGKAAA